MTEKRYKMKCHEINSWHIEKDGKVLIFDLFKSDAEILYTELNSLSDENEQLKETINKIKESMEYLKNKGGDVTLADVDGTLNKIDEILNGDNDD